MSVIGGMGVTMHICVYVYVCMSVLPNNWYIEST